MVFTAIRFRNGIDASEAARMPLPLRSSDAELRLVVRLTSPPGMYILYVLRRALQAFYLCFAEPGRLCDNIEGNAEVFKIRGIF